LEKKKKSSVDFDEGDIIDEKLPASEKIEWFVLFLFFVNMKILPKTTYYYKKAFSRIFEKKFL